MENKIKEVKESNSNAFSYTGDIHVKVVEDNRVYYDNYSVDSERWCRNKALAFVMGKSSQTVFAAYFRKNNDSRNPFTFNWSGYR